MRRLRQLASIAFAGMVLLGAAANARAADGETVAQIKSRGVLRCGLGENIPGFATRNPAGAWSGLDADFCRAVAAAVLGSPDRAAFVPLRPTERVPALEEGVIDVLSAHASWTLEREGALGLQFAGILYYDTQALIVRASDPVATASDLKGAGVCAQEGTVSLGHLRQWSAANQLDLQPVVLASAAEVRAAFFAGRCRAWTSDASQLAVARFDAPGGAQIWKILAWDIAEEPLGPAVREGDEAWLSLVRWVLVALVSAEQLGLTRENLAQREHEAAVRTALMPDTEVDRSLGVAPGWMLRAVGAVGNYGEIFERNLGSHSPFNIERGRNRLWTQGGLMYAPPTR